MFPRTVGAATFRVLLQVVAVAVVLVALWRGAAFVRLALVALVLAAAAETPVAALERRGWRRGLAIAAVFVGLLAVIVGAATVLVPRVLPQLEQAASAAPDLVSGVRESSEYRWLERHQLIERGLSEVRQNLGNAVGSLLSAAVGVASFAAAVITVAGLTAFALASGPASWEWILKWVHPSRRRRVRRLGAAVRSAVAGYVGGALVMGAIAGAVTAITTGLLGVPYFLALAVTTAVLGIIPFVGAIVTAVLVVVSTFVAGGASAGAIALVVFVAYQQLEGLVLQPVVQRHTISMNPLVVVSAVLLGTSAAGPFGGVIALPIAAAGKVIANDVLAHRRRAWSRRTGAASRASDEAASPPH